MPSCAEDFKSTMCYCVYWVWYPAGHKNAGKVCYVGEGKKERAYRDFRRDANANLSKLAHECRDPLEVEIIQTGLSKYFATRLERAVIRKIREMPGSALLNQYPGVVTNPKPRVRHETHEWVEDIINKFPNTSPRKIGNESVDPNNRKRFLGKKSARKPRNEIVRLAKWRESVRKDQGWCVS